MDLYELARIIHQERVRNLETELHRRRLLHANDPEPTTPSRTAAEPAPRPTTPAQPAEPRPRGSTSPAR